ncbi:hypothetical protein Ancab_018782 [Ancistrocladus abbreviatus]
MEALQSANDEDGIILEGDVIFGYVSYYPRYRILVRGLRSTARTVGCHVHFQSSTFAELPNWLVAEANERGRQGSLLQAGGIIDERSHALRVHIRSVCLQLSEQYVRQVQWDGEPSLSINFSVVPTRINVSGMSSAVFLVSRQGPNPLVEFGFLGGARAILYALNLFH